MKDRLVIIVAAIIFIIVLSLMIPYWLLTPVIDKRPLVTSIPLDASQTVTSTDNTSNPFVTAQPLQYQAPFGNAPFAALLDFNTEDVYGEEWVPKEFTELTTTQEFESAIAMVTKYSPKDFPPIYFSGRQLPPVVYNPSNSSQQSPR
jgi:hypothetical protein